MKIFMRMSAGIAAAACMMLIAGGLAVSSNTAFIMHKPIVLAGAGQIGNNWTSIPYSNPYATAGDLCAQTGLTSTGAVRAFITVLNETNGTSTAVGCGGAASNGLVLIPGKGLVIRQPNIMGAPTSIILVGSHNPALKLTIPDAGPGRVGRFWFSVPYHTTAVKAADLCTSIGLTSSGLQRAVLTRLNAATGAYTSVKCGTAPASALALVLGEHLEIFEPLGPKTFIPAHF